MTTTMTTERPPAPRSAHPSRPSVLRALRSPLAGRLLLPVVVLAIWYVSLRLVESVWPFAVDVLPTPGQVFGFMWDEVRGDTLAPDNLYVTFGTSLQRLAIGIAIAMGLGTAIGIGMGLSRRINAFFNDWVVAILAMPNLAWALFCSLAFGFGDLGPIVTVVLTGVPFVIINVREGVRNTPVELYDMARAFGVERSHIIRHVLIPSLMPFMFAAGRYAFALGWKGLVVAEVFGGQDGAGWTIKFWYDAHRAYGVIGYAFFFVIFALIFEKFMFDRLYAYLFRWRPALDSPDVSEQEFDTPNAAVQEAERVARPESAAAESLNQVTSGPRSERDATQNRRNDHG